MRTGLKVSTVKDPAPATDGVTVTWAEAGGRDEGSETEAAVSAPRRVRVRRGT